MFDELRVERRGAVLVVTINRPDRMNTFSQEVYDGLRDTWSSLADDPSIRAIVVTGAGDQRILHWHGSEGLYGARRTRPLKPDVHDEMTVTPLNCDIWLPTIIAVNGVCTGAGFHFIADADLVVASSTASFLDTHVSVGQVAAIEPITLLPRIGLGNALRLTVWGRHGRIGAQEALRIGLVDEVVAPDQLHHAWS